MPRGSGSAANVQACEDAAIQPLIAQRREGHHLALAERFAADPPAPEEAADAMRHLRHGLETPAGRAIYALRKQTLERVFGIIKQVMGFHQFLLRALKQVSGAWTLVALAWSIK